MLRAGGSPELKPRPLRSGCWAAGDGVSEGDHDEDGPVSAGEMANLIQLLHRKELLPPG